MNYREEFEASREGKRQYVEGLERLIVERQEALANKRRDFCKQIMTDAERYRGELRQMLGWPLVDHVSEGLPSVSSVRLAEEDGVTVWRMSLEILEGVSLSGLYFEKHGEGKRPLVLVQHGGLGTPEVISGLYGKTFNYNQMLERVIAYDVHAFAPQLLLWDKKYEVAFDRVEMDARLKRVGSSITAVEVFGLTRILDYFETRETVSAFGMVGLSYGGFYTLFLSALDERIRAAISCAFFNTRDRHPWCDWVWFDSAARFDDAEVAALIYPRRLWIEIADGDELFDFADGRRSFERLREICSEVGTDWVTLVPFEGAHEFCKDDAPIEALVRYISEL